MKKKKTRGKIREARVSDTHAIQEIINFYAKKGKMIPRSLSEVCENIRSYFLYEKGNEILGVCNLRVYWSDMGEVCSLAVKKKAFGRGIGSQLINKCIAEAKKVEIKKVFALTYEPDFFIKKGFVKVDKSDLPQKIWSDCIRCLKFPHCDEIALIKNLDEES
ncbi:MAG: GNAT family N-acetyltransferase [Candidatus Schekmanbacteria bacterium RBG_16_38_11]|uniref:GNAT family N-acetyltransferase n=1 Tax=Candidatus Schekmanbacteria bacterium RBG_16_38_11 TaxID=1817880 RepID=A0A1F7RTP2_9BACT|nr:MAG: GNAT family N-acetyltransferase [Candidatus Schekmanbacteria bacterium RBG_16_38_11]